MLVLANIRTNLFLPTNNLVLLTMVLPIFVGSPCHPVIFEVVDFEGLGVLSRGGTFGNEVAQVMAVKKSPPLN